ncbi:MAG: hypothetical protein H6981_14885 [Gammaproteobacteria bacterium]|nr:hypothetical protein [Gammaproteobacteria bacterium]MCP5138070.1 hypothetical protein [Gammaproteobacteria bacterium]
MDPKIVADGVIARECYAVVYAPKANRKRFPANCVEVFDTLDAAYEAADPGARRFAAEVIGPSRSSEGQQLFYLVRWLSAVD